MRLSEHVRSTHNQDGGVVLDIRQGHMFRLNLVGSRMLELLKQGCGEERIAEQISLEFKAPREIVSTDLSDFIEQLQRHRLLEPGEQEARAGS